MAETAATPPTLAHAVSDLIFVGCGSSGGTPSISCLIHKPCAVCKDALNPTSKNRRRNPSILIRYHGANILIDCGKTFRESMLREISEHNITRLDALIITHGHADAVNGLDDLREFRSIDGDVVPMPLYIRQKDLDIVSGAFPYIIDSSRATGSGFVSKIAPHVINDKDPFVVCGLTFIPILLDHGPNSTCLGFRFGDVAYLSDLVKLSDESRNKLLSFGPIELLIIDALFVERPNGSHFSLPESLAEIKRLKPKRAMLVGMSHDFDYHPMNERLKAMQQSDNIDVQCAFDGQVLQLPCIGKTLAAVPHAAQSPAAHPHVTQPHHDAAPVPGSKI